MQEVIISQKIKVDDCIVQEIVWLNSVGVHTIGSCCGHGKENPHTIIKSSSHQRAKELGYNVYFDKDIGCSGEWIVELKSICNCK